MTSLAAEIKITYRSNKRKIRRLRKLLQPPTWHGVPIPAKGGTYYYCQHPIEIKLKKFDKIGRWTGRYYTGTGPCLHRRRTFPAYVRHWRRTHGRA